MPELIGDEIDIENDHTDDDMPELIGDEIDIENDHNLIDNFDWIEKNKYLKKYYNTKHPSTSPIINISKKQNVYSKPICLLNGCSLCNDINFKKISKKKKELHYEAIFSKYYNDIEKVDGVAISNNMTISKFVLDNYKNHDNINCIYTNKCFICDYINKKKIHGIKNEIYLNKFLYTKDELINKINIII